MCFALVFLFVCLFVANVSVHSHSCCRTESFDLANSYIRSYTQSFLRTLLSLLSLGSRALFSLIAPICTVLYSYRETSRMTWENATRATYESRKKTWMLSPWTSIKKRTINRKLQEKREGDAQSCSRTHSPFYPYDQLTRPQTPKQTSPLFLLVAFFCMHWVSYALSSVPKCCLFPFFFVNCFFLRLFFFLLAETKSQTKKKRRKMSNFRWTNFSRGKKTKKGERE